MIIAHRGVAGTYPENTHISFQAALSLQVQMIEFDIQLTKDNEFVVIHDETLERTTNGKGIVKDYTLQELKELDAGAWKDERFKGEQIPTLAEMLEQYTGKVSMLIEVKHVANAEQMAKQLKDFLQKYQTENIIIQSFHSSFIKIFHELMPELPVGVLIKQQMKGISSKMVEELSFANYINPRITNITTPLLQNIHAKQAQCFIWTVRTEQQMKKALALKPDGIVTDYPEWFLLKEKPSNS